MANEPARKPTTRVGDESRNPEDEIRRRAYELFEARGREEGHQLEDWLRAQEEVTRRQVSIAA